MASLNKATIIGRLGKDPEFNTTRAGKLIATFSLATSKQWKDKTTGEKKEFTEWHRIVVFNERIAQVVQKYLKKGSQAYICGELATRKWTDKQGVERYTTEIVLQDFVGELILLDRAQKAPAPSEDDYGGSSDAEPFTHKDEIPY